MDLTEIWCLRITSPMRSMLNSHSGMRVAHYPDTGDQVKRVTGDFRKPVLAIGRKMNNRTHYDQPNGTPGSFFAVRIVSDVFTLATFGAGVSLLVKNS